MIEALSFLPGILLLMLANYTEKAKGLRMVTQAFLACVCLLVMLLGALVLSTADDMHGAMPAMDNISAYGWGLLLAGMASFVFFLKPARNAVSKVIDIDPENWLHATALVLGVLLVGVMLSTAASVSNIVELGKSIDTSVLAMMLQDAMFAIAAFVGVGWLVRRDFSVARKRLGLSGLSPKGFAVSLCFVAIAFAVLVAISMAAGLAGQPAAPGSEDPTIKILGGVTLITALAYAIGAGVGEELLFRGAMQPRFGMLLTAGIFTSMHIQYSDAASALSILAIGLLLGYERKKLNTTACIITHAAYNFTAFALAIV